MLHTRRTTRALAALAVGAVVIPMTDRPALAADRGCIDGKACMYEHTNGEGGRAISTTGANNRNYPGTGAKLDRNNTSANDSISSLRNWGTRAIVFCRHAWCGGGASDKLRIGPGIGVLDFHCQRGPRCWADAISGHYWD